MRYEEPVFRPPSEADSLIVQATVGCSWNHCTYCGMYRSKRFRTRSVEEVLGEVKRLPATLRNGVRRIFVADGDALALPTAYWERLLGELAGLVPHTIRVSAYATARNLLEKSSQELRLLRRAGLRLLYIGPESGDDVTLRSVAKGADFADHVAAAARAHEAEISQSLMFLLGAGGVERSSAHANGSAELITSMDPRYVSLLTLTIVEGTPLHHLVQRGRFVVPSVLGLLQEARTIIERASPSNAVFRCNHASNYLTLSGRLPRDRDKLGAQIDRALSGALPLRPEWARGL